MPRYITRGQACKTCRVGKRKCDGALDKCGRCARLNQDCLYEHLVTPLHQLETQVNDLQARIQGVQAAALMGPIDSWFKRLLRVPPSSSTPPRRIPSYVPLSLPQLLHAELCAWHPDQTLPQTLALYLLYTFIHHREHFYFDMNLSRICHAITLPEEHPDALHPSFANAIFLAGCSCSGPSFASLEPVFLQRVNEHLPNSLAHVDRLEEALAASVLLGWYYSRNSQMVAAHAVSATTGQMAMACGLNEISDPVAELGLYRPLLMKAKDASHVSDRIALFWSIYLLDRHMSHASALPASIPDHVITTVWSQSTQSIPDLKNWSKGSLADLFYHGSDTTNVANDTVLTVRAKATALLDRSCLALHLSKNSSKADSAFWTIHSSTCRALERVQATLPSALLASQLPFSPQEASSSSLIPAPPQSISRFIPLPPRVTRPTHILFLTQSIIHSAAIFLHDAHPNSTRNPQLAAAKAMAQETSILSAGEDVYLNVCFCAPWFCGAEFLLHEINRSHPPQTIADAERLRDLQAAFTSLVEGLQRLSALYPPIALYIRRLAGMLPSPTV